MNTSNRRRVLAIGIDAAEPTLVRQGIASGELPCLQKLLDQGSWNRVSSPSDIGSAAVWPTFLTGTEPLQHGVFSEWSWQPETMNLGRQSVRHLVPFWKNFQQSTVGVIDIPFAPFTDVTAGFEICEWGAHDIMGGGVHAAGDSAVAAILRRIGAHPLISGHPDAAGPQDTSALERLSTTCIHGVKLRGELAANLLSAIAPELSIIVFSELHTASHYLWHTLAPEHPLYRDDRYQELRPIAPGLTDIVREIDRQIGRLIEVLDPAAAVLVFSLHGMRPTRGVASILDPLLCEWGFARRAGWRAQSWGDRARSAFAAAKRRTPESVKKLYYRSTPMTLSNRLAQTTMLPSYDWSQTRAFALPSDQHGWIRVNLAGRERQGIVTAEEYDQTCSQLAHSLRALTAIDGRALVRDVVHVSPGAPPEQLPDLIVHWEDAALEEQLVIKNSRIEVSPTGMKYTGQHALEGFCLMKGTPKQMPPAPLAAKDLNRIICAALSATDR